MSREIKFRGKHKLDGKWVVGNLVKMFGEWCIQNPDSENDVYIVDLKTVGQYTGLKDRNGVEIYEGNKFLDHFENEYGEVFYCNDKACFMAKIHEYTHDEYGTTLENNLPLFEIDVSDLEILEAK